MGLFGDLFDFNGDGKLGALKRGAEFSVFINILDSDEEESTDEDADDYIF